MLRAYFLKSVYDLPTSKVLIENLKGNSAWRQLCGWEYPSQVPSEATFSRAFKEFSELNLLDKMHEAVIKENYTDKLVGHASMDSTAINGCEKSCRKNTPKKERKKKKRGRSTVEGLFLPSSPLLPGPLTTLLPFAFHARQPSHRILQFLHDAHRILMYMREIVVGFMPRIHILSLLAIFIRDLSNCALDSFSYCEYYLETFKKGSLL